MFDMNNLIEAVRLAVEKCVQDAVAERFSVIEQRLKELEETSAKDPRFSFLKDCINRIDERLQEQEAHNALNENGVKLIAEKAAKEAMYDEMTIREWANEEAVEVLDEHTNEYEHDVLNDIDEKINDASRSGIEDAVKEALDNARISIRF